MLKKILLIVSIFGICNYLIPLHAQSHFSQTIRGRVIDNQTDKPLEGVIIILLNSDPLRGAVTDASGNFAISEVPVGRQSLKVTSVGYKPVNFNNLLLHSSKELVLEIRLEENVKELSDVVVFAPQNKERAQNIFATTSARAFTVEETERYAGSLGDPSRMVANYAGVMGVDDNRNDIIIRGNSPTGLLWRLEGIDIPNPNHFSSDGATGGPVSMINSNLLANSDFYTGAFPAEFGNALAGVFDLKLRNGNNQKYEYLGQIGFGGFELGAEGPFSKKHPSSFIINYRYSTLAVLDLIGLKFDFGTGGAVPKYQDLCFKINIPTKKLGRIEIFGLGGLSSIAMIENKRDESLTSVLNGVDFYNKTNTGIFGLKHTYYLKNDARITTKLSVTGSMRETMIDSLRENSANKIWRFYASRNIERNYRASLEYNKKINTKNNIQIGINSTLVDFNYTDSVYYEKKYQKQFDDNGNYLIFQAYTTWQHKFSNNLTLNTGIHALTFSLNNNRSIEPRLGLKWQLNPRQSIYAGGGIHSQTQVPLIYFYKDTDSQQRIYKDLGFNKAIHYVLGHDYMFGNNFRLKTEIYYQQIYNIPISEHETPQFSLINSGDNYYYSGRNDMVNKGKARNYGLELTLEKFLSEGYYFLVTASLFDSKYSDAQNVWHNTKFNGKYVFNLLGGYEFTFNQESSLLLDLKGVLAGGKWETPIDKAASIAKNKTVLDWSRAYTEQVAPYFKLNARITYRLNGKKTSQEWALDLQNLTNHRNVYMTEWDATNNKTKTAYQQGFMPMMTYRILF